MEKEKVKIGSNGRIMHWACPNCLWGNKLPLGEYKAVKCVKCQKEFESAGKNK